MEVQPTPLVFALTMRNGPIDPEVLFDLVIQACFNGDRDGPNWGSAALVDAMVSAYCEALITVAADDPDNQGLLITEIVPCYTEFEDAERDLNAIYAAAYEGTDLCGWPNVLSDVIDRTHPLPKRIVHVIAQAMAQRDNASFRAFQKFQEKQSMLERFGPPKD